MTHTGNDRQSIRSAIAALASSTTSATTSASRDQLLTGTGIGIGIGTGTGTGTGTGKEVKRTVEPMGSKWTSMVGGGLVLSKEIGIMTSSPSICLEDWVIASAHDAPSSSASSSSSSSSSSISTSGAVLVYSPGRISALLRPKDVVLLNLQHFAVFFIADLGLNDASARRQNSSDNFKRAEEHSLESPMAYAALLSLAGVGSLVIHRWVKFILFLFMYCVVLYHYVMHCSVICYILHITTFVVVYYYIFFVCYLYMIAMIIVAKILNGAFDMNNHMLFFSIFVILIQLVGGQRHYLHKKNLLRHFGGTLLNRKKIFA